MIRVPASFLFLLFMLAAVTVCDVAVAGESPHALCSDCHGENNQLKSTPVTLLCLTCHPSRRADHPLVAVPPEMPATLPLDGNRTMPCLTCHEPHGKGEGEKMLRKQNEALCQDCHQK